MTQIPHAIKVGLAVATPIPYVQSPAGGFKSDTITVEWHRAQKALSTPTNFFVYEIVADGMEVGAARSMIAERVLEHDPQPEFVFFLDCDVIPEFDAITKLIYRARHWPDYDIFAGVYTPKGMSPPEPIIYAGDGSGPYWDWTVGDLLTTDRDGITGTHMGCTLIRTSLFERLPEDKKPWFYTTNEKSRDETGSLRYRRGTEDLYFCKLAREEAGAKILIDTSVLCAHIDKSTGIKYGLPYDCGPVQRAKWMPKLADHSRSMKGGEAGGAEVQDVGGDGYTKQKKALDLGAGSTRRQLEGYKVYTTDIRPDTKPDYVQDTRWLNLPDKHFDHVMSSHHLEHLGRHDQERVWAEMFRVLKPGGTMEHVVPNVEWAAHKIGEGKVDEHVMNVLYGAQEAHGYARNFNTHYFGYTPIIGYSLACTCGLVDVQIADYVSSPDLGYNLIIKGRKPKKGEKLAASNGQKKKKTKATKKGEKRSAPAKKTKKKTSKGSWDYKPGNPTITKKVAKKVAERPMRAAKQTKKRSSRTTKARGAKK